MSYLDDVSPGRCLTWMMSYLDDVSSGKYFVWMASYKEVFQSATV